MNMPTNPLRWKCGATAAVSGLLLLAGCGQGDTSSDGDATPSVDSDAYAVGVWGPMDWLQGQGIAQGASLAAKELNEQGGIGGREIQVLTEDSEGDPEGAATVVRRLLERDVDALIGGYLTGEVLAVVDVISDAQTPYINPGASSMSIQAHVAEDYPRYKYLFRIGVNVEHIADEACRYLEEVGLDYGATHVGIIYDDLQWTEELRPFLLECIDDFGLDVSQSGYDRAATDFSANFFDVMNQGADWLVVLSAAPEGIIIGQQWGELQIPAPLTGFLAEAQEEGFLEATNGAGAHVGPIWQGAVEGVDVTPLTDDFLRSYTEEYGEAPIYNAFAAYEGMYALAAAVDDAGTTEADPVVEALEGIDIDGVYGRITFNETHERHYEGADPPLGIQLTPDGERNVITGPRGVETTEFVPPPWIDR